MNLKFPEGITISTDKNKLQVDVIRNYLANHSYWNKNISEERLRTAIANSICFGVYENEKQIGFARATTDYTIIAYIADVFILEEHRGKGLSKLLMHEIVNHPDLKNLRRLILATKDAHGLYKQFGFNSMEFPERWMEKVITNLYKDGEWIE